MESDRPKLTRAGTMKTTAEEGAAFLERQGFDRRIGGSKFLDNNTADQGKEEENDGSNSEPSPKRLKRQSTMAVTAKEGADFLQRQGYEPDSPEGTPTDQGADQSTPKVKRNTTMDVTAREGFEFIARMQGTEERNVTFDDHVTTITPPRPKLQRDSTIDVTVKEGEAFLERVGGTRQAKDSDDDEPPESVGGEKTETPTRPKLQRDSTIDVTVKEGEAFLRRTGASPEDDDKNEGDNGDEAVVDVRADTPEDDEDENKIGGEFVGEETEQESESSKPRRAPLKRVGTMDVTKAEGEEFLKRKKT